MKPRKLITVIEYTTDINLDELNGIHGKIFFGWVPAQVACRKGAREPLLDIQQVTTFVSQPARKTSKKRHGKK